MPVTLGYDDLHGRVTLFNDAGQLQTIQAPGHINVGEDHIHRRCF